MEIGLIPRDEASLKEMMVIANWIVAVLLFKKNGNLFKYVLYVGLDSLVLVHTCF